MVRPGEGRVAAGGQDGERRPRRRFAAQSEWAWSEVPMRGTSGCKRRGGDIFGKGGSG